MEVPSPTHGQVPITNQGMDYLKPATPDLSGLQAGLEQLARGAATWDAGVRAQQDRVTRFKTLTDFTNFETGAGLMMTDLARSAKPDMANFEENAIATYDNYERKFLTEKVPPELQDEFRVHLAATRQKFMQEVTKTGIMQRDGFYKGQITDLTEQGKNGVGKDFNTLPAWKARLDASIDASGLDEATKAELKKQNGLLLDKVAYANDYKERALRGKDVRGARTFLTARGIGDATPERISQLRPVFSGRLAMIINDAEKATGDQIRIRSAFRTNAEQQQAYRNKLAGRTAVAATPRGMMRANGTVAQGSRHEWGMAADLEDGPALRWMHKHASEYGLSFLSGQEFVKDSGHIFMPGKLSSDAGTVAGTEPVGMTFGNLIQAQRNAESANWRNKDISSAGAAGPMQVMPKTAREIAAELKDPNFNSAWNDSQIQNYLMTGKDGKGNLIGDIYGQHYMAKMLEQNGGDMELALIAYNAGQDVANLYQKSGRNPQVLAGETIDYVNKVMNQLGTPDNIDNAPQYANIPYEDRLAMRTNADAEVAGILKDSQTQQDAANKSLINDLKVAILDNKAGPAERDAARAAGILTQYSDIKEIDELLKKRDENADLGLVAAEKINTGTPFSLTEDKDKKGLDILFGKQGEAAINGGDKGYVDNVLVPLTQRAAMIPPQAVGQLDALSRSNNPTQMLFGLETLAKLQDASPSTFNAQVNEKLREKVNTYAVMRNSVPAEDLISVMRGGTTAEARGARESLLKDFDRIINDTSNPNRPKFENFMATFDEEWLDDPQAPGNPWAQFALQNDWTTMVREYYVKTGNIDMAQELASKQLSATWGVSHVGGMAVLMKHPPEKLYPALMATPDWMERQVRTEYKLDPSVQFQLLSDGTTQTDIAQRQLWAQNQQYWNTATPRPPTYIVSTYKDGVWTDVKDEQGNPVRVGFQVTPEQKQKERVMLDVEQKRARLNSLAKDMDRAYMQRDLNGTPVPPELQAEVDGLMDDLINSSKELADKPSQNMPSPDKLLTQIEVEYNQAVGRLQRDGTPVPPDLESRMQAARDWMGGMPTDERLKTDSTGATAVGTYNGVQVFSPPSGTNKFSIWDVFGSSPPDDFTPETTFATMRQTDNAEDINGIWAAMQETAIPPDKMRGMVDHLLGKIPKSVFPESGKEAFKEILDKGKTIPLARLGLKQMDPNRIVLYDPKGEKTNLGGVYTPMGDWLFFSADHPAAFVHEIMHRSVEQLKHKLTPDERDYLENEVKSFGSGDGIDGNEALVRNLMNDYFWGVEKDAGDASRVQVEAAERQRYNTRMRALKAHLEELANKELGN